MNARPRVLLVDDSPTVGARVLGVLRDGYDVRVAEGAVAAVLKVLSWPPNVILLDLNMPAVGGEAVAASLRRAMRSVAPIIVFTDAARDAAEAARARIGAVRVLSKGCTNSSLRMAVALALIPAPPE